MEKKDFIELAENEIKVNECFLNMVEIIEKVLAKFVEKQVNKRIETAINKAFDENIAPIDRRASCSLKKEYCHFTLYSPFVGKRRVGEYSVEYSPNKEMCLYFSTTNNGTLDGEKTFAYLTKFKESLEKRIEEHKDAIRNYDEYKKMNDELFAFVKQYNEKCNMYLRRSVNIGREYYG